MDPIKLLSLFSFVFIWLLSLLSAFPCYAAREFKVYPAQTAAEGETEISLWNNYTSSNSHPYLFMGNPVSKSNLMEYSMELEYGVTERLTVEGYADFEQPQGEPLQYVQAKAVLARYRLISEDEKLWDTSIYVEYSLPKDLYAPSELETRLLLEKAFGRWSVRINPILSKDISGTGMNDEVEFSYAAGVYWRNFHYLVPALELMGAFGSISTPAHEHYIFPGFALNFGSGWKWETGVGFGLTDDSDRMIIKNIISYSRLF